jgi:gamma-glutamyltranspeptidase/glutathione hydrolase
VSLEAVDRRARSTGYRATTVPSTPSTLAYALKHYGTLPLKQVLEPAIRLADKGFAVTALQEALTRREAKRLKAGTAGRFFLKNGRRPYREGAVLRQRVLARTLRRLGTHGVQDFYTGEIASAIEQDMIAHDGLLRRDDLAQMPLPLERHPLTCRFEGSRVLTCPLPGAGRTLVLMLNAYPNLPARLRRMDSPPGALAMAALIRWAFVERRDRPFDPNYYGQTAGKQMLRADYAKDIARQIAKRIPTSGETTHLSVMDANNNAVALTHGSGPRRPRGSRSCPARVACWCSRRTGAATPRAACR